MPSPSKYTLAARHVRARCPELTDDQVLEHSFALIDSGALGIDGNGKVVVVDPVAARKVSAGLLDPVRPTLSDNASFDDKLAATHTTLVSLGVAQNPTRHEHAFKNLGDMTPVEVDAAIAAGRKEGWMP